MLRVIAAIAVIAIHMTNHWNLSSIIIDNLARFGIPVFVIISGYCILPKADSFKYVIKKSLRLFLIMLVWSLVYFVYYLKTDAIVFSGLKALIKYLLTEPIFFWYFYMAICLYLISPALKVFQDNANKKLYLYALGICFIFGSLVTILVKAGISPTLNLILEKTKFAYALGFPCMYLAGGYIKKFGIEKKHRIALYTSAIVLEILAIIVIICAFNNGNANIIDLMTSFCAPNHIVMGIAVFTAISYCSCAKCQSNGKAKKVITYLASLTLGIFVVHPIIINCFTRNDILSNCLFCQFVAVLIISIIIAAIINAIPGLKKII